MNNQKYLHSPGAALICLSEKGIILHTCTHISIIYIICSPLKEAENQNTTVHLSNFVPMPLNPLFQVSDPIKKKGAMFYSFHHRFT